MAENSAEHFDPNSDGFGFLIEPEADNRYPNTSWEVRVSAITGRSCGDGGKVYGPINSDEDSEPYLVAYLKWDGCFEFHYETGSMHFCGVRDLLLHCALVKRLHAKAYELMQREPQTGEEWPEAKEMAVN